MGLDMYLKDQNKEEILIYWRKSNQIHKWFQDNCCDGEIKNCDYYEVSREQLSNLKKDCDAVLSGEKSAKDTLPTQSGFFFGDTRYNDDYLYDLAYTAYHIGELLENNDSDRFYYQAWW